MARLVVVSADGHAGAPPEAYREYLESRYHDDLEVLVKENEQWLAGAISQSQFSAETLELIDGDGVVRSGGELGAWDFDRRLRELDREGVAAEILIAGHQLATLPFFSHINRPYPPELRAAGVRAYHRQLAEGMAQADGRLVGVADAGPCHDMAETVKELRWVAAHGFVSVAPPLDVADPGLPPVHDAYYEPFWAACADLGLVLTAHAGYGMPQFGVDAAKERQAMAEEAGQEAALMASIADDDTLRIDELPADSVARQALSLPRRLAWQLMLAGVFDRYPSLQLVLTESRADWVPGLLAHLDAAYEAGAFPSRRRPSEYWAQNCAVAPSSPRPYEIALRQDIGETRLLFGMDYPHPEGTWPNTREWLRVTFAGVSESDLRAIAGRNAIDIYGLDADRLERVAARVGPDVADILGDHDVDPRLVKQFHDRSGFARPQEQHDPEFFGSWMRQDVLAIST